jgi:ATP-dependent Lon protease
VNVGRPRSVRLVEAIQSGERGTIAVLSQRDGDVEEPDFSDLYTMGTSAKVLKVIKVGPSSYSVVLQGLARIELRAGTSREPTLSGRFYRHPDRTPRDVEIDALALNLRESARSLAAILPEAGPDAARVLESVPDAGALADHVAATYGVSTAERQEVLELVEIRARLRHCLQIVARQLEFLKVKREISSMVQQEMGKNQREYILRQQLKAIREELSEADDSDDLDVLREKVSDAGLPPEAERAAKKQLGRLRQMEPSSAEYTVARTYLDWILDLPWKRAAPDRLEVAEVRRVLDEDHYDLEKVKRRILEYIAVRKLKSDKKGPILCFAGPPGVGKTSLGRSIARALGRRFVRISLGGVRDEAEIRGHRRTYVGSLPGRILQGMKKAGTVNPVFVLDEVDKLGADVRGDPSAALLEVLDPEQNGTFADHYLEIPYDLSQVIFLCTANVMDSIPAPLLDRMEVIEIPGYTRMDKMRICREHLVPKELHEHGLSPERLEFSDEALALLVEGYTREAGVRGLGREIGSLCRAIAVRIAEGEDLRGVVADADLVRKTLGPEKFIAEVAERTGVKGVAAGLAWTSVGGEIMFVEATRMPGKGALHLTGSLGEVMKESVVAAFTWLRAHPAALGLADDFVAKDDVHVHLPKGGTPKDGPSGGVAILTALVSLFTGRRVRPDVAMTGEITLRGLVLPVGGIKDKVLAAHRAGIRRVILPARNEKDVGEIQDEVLETLEIRYVRRVEEVLDAAIEGKSVLRRGGRKKTGSRPRPPPPPASG